MQYFLYQGFCVVFGYVQNFFLQVLRERNNILCSSIHAGTIRTVVQVKVRCSRTKEEAETIESG